MGPLFRKDRVQSQAETLYAAISAQSRAPEFYGDGGAPDTPEGRFEMLALHMFLAIDRLRREAPATDRLIRRLQDVFFRSLDSALREMGVGDLSVGRKIRGFSEAFYGRFSVYERAAGDEAGALDAAIARNVLSTDDAVSGRPLADYIRAARRNLKDAAAGSLTSAFGDLGDLTVRQQNGVRHDAFAE